MNHARLKFLREHLCRDHVPVCLDLGATNVTDTELEELPDLVASGQLGAFLALNLWRTRVTEFGLVRLPELNLTGLHLTSTDNGDFALERQVARMTTLEWLSLSRTLATEAGLLKNIPRLTALQKLHVDYTMLSNAGWARLRELAPSLQVAVEPQSRTGFAPTTHPCRELPQL